MLLALCHRPGWRSIAVRTFSGFYHSLAFDDMGRLWVHGPFLGDKLWLP
jgi:hypothetical protein